jgi:hypothetical protein
LWGTVAELGEMLGCYNFSIAQGGASKIISWQVGTNITAYNYKMAGKGSGNLHLEQAETEADARAKMLIYLLEEKSYGDQVAKQFAQCDRRNDV